MPRKPRIEYKGALYHILNRGIRRETIFIDSGDYKRFMDNMVETQGKYPFICYGYVLMPNHFHLIIEKADVSLGTVMKSLLSRYALYFNKKYNRTGPLFQGRYHSFLCQKENYLLMLVRYIHQNPVRAGLVSKMDKWYWSSLRTYMGEKAQIEIDVDFILDMFGGNNKLESFKKFMGEFNAEDRKFLYPEDDIRVIGDKKFIRKINTNIRELRRKTDQQMRYKLGDLGKILCDKYGIDQDELTSNNQKRRVSLVRALLSFIAHDYCGHKVINIAKYLGKDPSAVSHAIDRIKGDDFERDVREILDLLSGNSNYSNIQHRPCLKR